MSKRIVAFVAAISVALIVGACAGGGNRSGTISESQVAGIQDVSIPGGMISIPRDWQTVCEPEKPFFKESPKIGVICNVSTKNATLKIGATPKGTSKDEVVEIVMEFLTTYTDYDDEERRISLTHHNRGAWEITGARYIYASSGWAKIGDQNYFAFRPAGTAFPEYDLVIFTYYGEGSSDGEVYEDLVALMDGMTVR